MQAELIQATESPVPGMADPESLELIDLLNDLGALGNLLLEQVRLGRSPATSDLQAEHVLDAFLLAAGMNQVTEDYMHRPNPSIAALAGLTKRSAPAAYVLGRVQGGIEVARCRTQRLVDTWQRSLDSLVAMLARAVVGATHREDEIESLALALVEEMPRLPESLRRAIVRLPDSFRGFDQQPDDCRRLAQELTTRWPDRGRPLLVVGVRTSGSYLAPLQAAYLVHAGFRQVSSITFRPGQAWSPRERALLRQLPEIEGLALLIDDPPVTGNKLAASADELERIGVPPGSIVLLVPLLGGGQVLPARLRPRQTVVLPWHLWSINDRLTDSSLQQALSHILVGRDVRLPHENRDLRVAAVDDVEPLELEPITDIKSRPLVRSHLRTARRVRVRDKAGVAGAIDVYVKGTGLGYFGRHSMAVAKRMEGRVPETYGWLEGLLFRALLPEAARLTNALDGKAAAPIASYVVSRAHVLQAPEDKSLRMRHRHAARDLVGDVLASGFGRLRPLVSRPLERYTTRVLRPANAAVIDGSTALPQWFYESNRTGPSHVVKVDFDERAFSVWDLYCYDPVMDLAITAADWEFRLGVQGQTDFGGLLMAEYRRLTGEVVSDERWFLYRLLHLSSAHFHFERLQRDGPLHLQTQQGSPASSPDVEEHLFDESLAADVQLGDRALARLHNAYVAGLYTHDLSSGTGPLCEIAVEGLLESDRGRLTSDGALVLRSLIAHGFRPRLVTNRSSQELLGRCAAYRAVGGLARDAEVTVDGQPSTGQCEGCLRSRADVTALLGHSPAGCRVCRRPRLSPDSRVIMAAMDAHQRRGFRRVADVVRLMSAERTGRRARSSHTL